MPGLNMTILVSIGLAAGIGFITIFVFGSSTLQTTKSFTIDVVGQKFIIQATDPITIQQLLDNYNGKNSMHITGTIVSGNGGFNYPYSWHLDPATVRMADMSIEVCDGTPSHVQQNLDYWLGTVHQYCPWSSKVVGVND